MMGSIVLGESERGNCERPLLHEYSRARSRVIAGGENAVTKMAVGVARILATPARDHSITVIGGTTMGSRRRLTFDGLAEKNDRVSWEQTWTSR